ncbi:MAG: hypothetical protein Q8L93_07970 [Rhodocyclaceae bacterium]|nr:hypothetical protein [Rhodocyclaceae bacterium]
MTKLKDKLSASVRTAKAAQQKATPARTAATQPATKPAPKPAAAKTADPQTDATRTPASALFPDRVWPD